MSETKINEYNSTNSTDLFNELKSIYTYTKNYIKEPLKCKKKYNFGVPYYYNTKLTFDYTNWNKKQCIQSNKDFINDIENKGRENILKYDNINSQNQIYIINDTTLIHRLDVDEYCYFHNIFGDLKKYLNDNDCYKMPSRNSPPFDEEPTFHYLVKFINLPTKNKYKTQIIYKDTKEVICDLLHGQCACYIIDTPYIGSKIIEVDFNKWFSYDNKDYIIDSKKTNNNIKFNNMSNIQIPKIEFFDEILELFNEFKTCDEVCDNIGWLKLAGVIKCQFGDDGKRLFVNYSYDVSNLNKVSHAWEHSKCIHPHWLFKICEKYNKNKFNKIIDKHNYCYKGRNSECISYKKIQYNQSNCDTAEISSLFYQLFQNKFIYQFKKWYVYNGDFWYYEDCNGTMIKYYSNKFCTYFYWCLNQNNKEISVCDTEEEIEKINVKNDNISKIIVMCRNITTIEKCIKHSISLFNVGEKFKFNVNPFIIQHRNCVYDLKTCEIKKSSPSYYTNQTTNVNITNKKDCEENIKYIEDIINNIFYGKDEQINKSNYMEFLSTGLYGETLEKFIISSGCGGNGKGVINDFMMYMLNDDINNGYSYEAPPHIFQTIFKGGASPEIFNMNYKRFVRTAEPSKKKTLIGSLLKLLTGGCKINARALYSGDTNCNICISLFIESNFKVAFDTFDGGIKRRVEPIEFKSTFRNIKDIDELIKDEKHTEDEIKKIIIDRENTKTFKKNPYLKSNSFKKKYAESLFWILTEYWEKYKNRGYEVEYNSVRVENKKEYAVLSDEFTEWIDNRYMITDNVNDIVKITDIFNKYRSGDYYENLSRREKRKNNKKVIVQKLQANPLFGKYYRARTKLMRHIMINMKEKDDNSDFDDDFKKESVEDKFKNKSIEDEFKNKSIEDEF